MLILIILARYLTPDILTIILLIYPINLGQKILYPLGQATGDLRSRMRSQAMNRQLNAVGLYDSIDTRAYLSVHLYLVYYDSTNVTQIQPNGYKIKESLLMGPRGGLKMESIWDDQKLVTIMLFGKKE